jgi:hypothetical protein
MKAALGARRSPCPHRQRLTVFFTSSTSKSPYNDQKGGREEHEGYQYGEIGEIALHSDKDAI